MPVVNASKMNKSYKLVLFSLLIFIFVLSPFYFIFKNRNINRNIPVSNNTPTAIVTETPGGQDNLVIGLNISDCCSCPVKVPSSQIGKDGWVIYEKGKNYSSLLPQKCKLVDCAPCPPLENESYSCPSGGWVNCMPGPNLDNKSCSKEAQNWYKTNCPDYQGVAY